jgi:hypothetical protein
LKYLVSTKLTDVLHIYGKNKKEWQNVLLDETLPSQLTEQFGGIIKEPVDFHEFLRKSKSVFKCPDDFNEMGL